MIQKQIIQNIKFIVVLFIIYFVLFEFIFPKNKFIPQPNVLIESFIHLWSFYNFFFALISTTSIIYFSILISFFFLHYFRIVIIKNIISFNSSLNVLNIFKYFPAFFIVILFSVWFQGNLVAEIIFALLISLTMMLKKISSLISDVKKEYIIFAHQVNPNKMFSEVYWKNILPNLIFYFYDLQIYLWILILIYEFISESYGVGLIYRKAYDYNDIGAIYSITITMSVVIWLSNLLLRFIEKKKIYWSIG